MTPATASSRVDNIRHSLVGLKMPRALEMLDATLRRIEQGEIDGIEAIDPKRRGRPPAKAPADQSYG